MKFKVGDIVTGITSNRYGVTNSDAMMRVVRVWKAAGGPDAMEVEVLTHARHDYEVGHCYPVEQRFFSLVGMSQEAPKVPKVVLSAEEMKAKEIESRVNSISSGIMESINCCSFHPLGGCHSHIYGKYPEETAMALTKRAKSHRSGVVCYAFGFCPSPDVRPPASSGTVGYENMVIFRKKAEELGWKWHDAGLSQHMDKTRIALITYDTSQ